MIPFSCWSFKENYTMETIAERIIDNPNRDVSSSITISLTKILDFDKNKFTTLNILGNEVRCIFFKLSPNDAEQSYFTDMDVLIYEFNNKVYINAFRGHNTAYKFLKDYFNGTWGGISPEKPEVGEDLLYWMFKSFIDKSSQSPLDSQGQLYVTSLKRYRGVTKDQGNTLTGEGDRISEILGTLAFLLNNDLKLLKTKVTYRAPNALHSLVLEIRLTGTINFDISYYDGDFKALGDIEKLKVAISILITRTIIPKIIESYKDAIVNAKWSASLKRDFIERIGDEIKKRVDREIEKLNQAIPKVTLTAINIDPVISENCIADEAAIGAESAGIDIDNDIDIDTDTDTDTDID